MAVKDTLVGRLKKLLRIQFGIKTGSVTGDSALGAAPMGFSDAFIKQEFRTRVNDWSTDLVKPFPTVSWDGDTTLVELAAELIKKAKVDDIGKIKVYRAHIGGLAEAAFDHVAGVGAGSVPVADRPVVRDAMNADLGSLLLTDISLGDLAGDRATILSNVADRMVI